MITQRSKRPKKSSIWKIPTTELQQALQNSVSISQILKHFGLANIGGNYVTLRQRLEQEGIDYSHIPRGIGSNKGKKFPEVCMTLEECKKTVFVHNSTYTRKTARRYLLRYELIDYGCELCANPGAWQDKKLSLQLDHKDGVRNNHHLENLRWLCPNCHSQTDTFAGKSNKKC